MLNIRFYKIIMSEQEKFLRTKKENLEGEKLPKTEEAARIEKEEDEKIEKEILDFFKTGMISELVGYAGPPEESYRVLRKSGILKNPEELPMFSEKSKNFTYVLGNSKSDNLKFLIDRFKIRDFSQFEKVINNVVVRGILENAKLENLELIVGFYKIEKPEQLVAALDISPRIVFKSVKKENLRIFTLLCKDTKELKEVRQNKYGFELLEESIGGNFQFLVDKLKIRDSKQLLEFANSYETLKPILTDNEVKIDNLENAFKNFEIKDLVGLNKICERDEFAKILKAKTSNFNYLAENKIINRHNFFRLNQDAIENLDEIFPIHFVNQEKIDFLKKLLDQYPNAAANTLITLENSRNRNFLKDEKDIFEALEKIGAVTPVIFEKFKKLGLKERDEFAAEIKRTKKELFKNKPIDAKGSENEMAELIYIAYRPIGMSYEDVKKLIPQLEDRTEDLEDYKFPEDGYEITLTPPVEKIIKSGKEIDYKKIEDIVGILKKSYESDAIKKGEMARNERIFSILNKIAKATPYLEKKEIGDIFWLMENESIPNFLRKNFPEKGNINKLYPYLLEVKEIFGVIFKDNFYNDLKSFLKLRNQSPFKNKKDIEKIKETLLQKKEPFLKALGKEFKDSEIGKDEYWQKLDIEKIANLLAIFFDQKIISNLRKDINMELNKIIDKGIEAGTKREKKEKKIKAYISKNIASFFGKASAGICTARDIETFNRSDHFHINLAEEKGEDDEIARGNAQAYIIDDGDKKSLLLRGINPNSDFLYEVDVKSLCEKIIAVAKKFGGDNNMENVYLSEQLGSWHALSNRPPVNDYLGNEYIKEKNEKDFEFKIASGAKISKIYKI